MSGAGNTKGQQDRTQRLPSHIHRLMGNRDTKPQAALRYNDKCITNSAGAMEAHSTGDLAHHWGPGKAFPEEVTSSRSDPGEVKEEGISQEEVIPFKGLEASEDTQCIRAW